MTRVDNTTSLIVDLKLLTFSESLIFWGTRSDIYALNMLLFLDHNSQISYLFG